MTQKIIQELEERISLLRAEMRNLTGRDRHTQQRMINELADKIARLRRERKDELSSTSWDEHDIGSAVNELKGDFENLLSLSVEVKKNNTDEFMTYFRERINGIISKYFEGGD